MEKHYTPDEVAEMWALSPATVRRLFSGEPGVRVFAVDTRPGRRQKRTIRIPESVLKRVEAAVTIR